MLDYPAVIIHGLEDARAVLRLGRAVTLISAPGAGLYAGCGWWAALIGQARAAFPDMTPVDVLDCADGAGSALAALRIGVPRLVLWRGTPGADAVAEIARAQGGFVLDESPKALDLSQRGAIRRLEAWVQVRSGPGDIPDETR